MGRSGIRIVSPSSRPRLSFRALGVNSEILIDDEPLARVREHVLENLERQCPLSDAASIAGLERTYFSSYFHSKVGIPYKRWINAVRVSRSLRLLTETELRVDEVAERIGFNDVRTFQRNFNRLTGMTPSGFRSTFCDAARE